MQRPVAVGFEHGGMDVTFSTDRFRVAQDFSDRFYGFSDGSCRRRLVAVRV